MKKYHLIIFCLILLTGQVAAQTDALGLILDTVGFDRSDLGFAPKGYWNRYPLEIPYRLASFDDLFAEPLKLIDYTKTMGASVEKYLEPDFFDTTSEALYYLTYSLGVDRRMGGFRNYSANLLPVDSPADPLIKAIGELYLLSGQPYEYSTFGSYVDDRPPYKRKITALLKEIDHETEAVLARAIHNLADIIYWRNLAFRRCDRETMAGVFRIRDLASTQSDGIVYYPGIDDIALDIDWPSLHYAGLKTAALIKETSDTLSRLNAFNGDKLIDITTPYGRIVLIGKDYRDFPVDLDNTLLAIDFGADGEYSGAVGANAGLDNPVSLFIDLGGNDRYIESAKPSCGSGLLGIGALYDRSGDDIYRCGDLAEGFGFFGMGLICDRSGQDDYRAGLSAQGCGYFGIGLACDVEGDDIYYLYGDGQGYGGVGGGVGVLADYDGNDKYTGEPSSEVYDRGDYHSDHKINGNGVQGVGFGRRGDGSDGHSWAGGLGAIIDIHGNDHYLSGNWSLGCGYWFATGIAYDKEGDDYYESCYFTQASGAHYCNGILLDEAGKDRHELYETAGAGLGFGWDFANALLINIGGDDSYYANMISMGLAQIRSFAFLIDIGGNDKYMLKSGTAGLGEATYREDYRYPRDLAPYYYYNKSFGGFIDIGGKDEYLSFDEISKSPHPRARNNSLWSAPAPKDSTYGANNYGVGIDLEEGSFPELDKWSK